jgi:membrane protein DedA with SNARE-associated domain
MGRWAGWGAGPAGAGAAGGPSRLFLAAALLGSAIVTGLLVADGNLGGSAISGLAAVYFALRLFAGLGRSSR